MAQAERTYRVEGMSCEHCRATVAAAVERVAGVAAVDVDLAAKRVHVRGDDLDDARLRGVIAEAGYEVVS